MNLIHYFKSLLKQLYQPVDQSEHLSLLLGRSLSESIIQKKHIESLAAVEFKVFSQFGDDGIIQWLIHQLNIPHKTFIEFGVGNYQEANTRFLMMNNNWSGLVMDCSETNIADIKNSNYFWKYELLAQTAFITKDNVLQLTTNPGFDPNLGLLHIDLDGNDYWIWKEIEHLSPIIVILEYNSVFGIERAITVPYDQNFNRTKAHFSQLYYGASLKALYLLSKSKGYTFIGCNNAGNNAYFIRNDYINDSIKEVSLDKGYVLSKFRESRNEDGQLTYLSGKDRLSQIKGLPIYNTETNQIEPL